MPIQIQIWINFNIGNSDPDRHQNDADPQHCKKGFIIRKIGKWEMAVD
jgi:hypothetical protein